MGMMEVMLFVSTIRGRSYQASSPTVQLFLLQAWHRSPRSKISASHQAQVQFLSSQMVWVLWLIQMQPMSSTSQEQYPSIS